MDLRKWLAEQFEYELCHVCGKDSDRHEAVMGPFGKPLYVCLDLPPEE